ncbi:MAG TPA: TIGR02206 family membrane protein, partial [Enhygromyxa sp.]|nr:TIGR02206 family membrane protein [Enhygromyxa sp.]
IFVGLYALWSKRRIAAELLYFWTCSGTFLAMILPAIDRGFPSYRFFIYFALHGGVVVTSVVLVYGMGLYPDRRSPLRAYGLTMIYIVVIAALDLATGQNYLFLAHKPPEETLLDYMGPWPLYVMVALAIGLGLFYLLNWPFRGREPGPDR